jgi:hypothetical protein
VWYQALDNQTMERVWQGLDVMTRACTKVWNAKK